MPKSPGDSACVCRAQSTWVPYTFPSMMNWNSFKLKKKVNTLSYNLPLIGYSHQLKDQRVCYRTLLNIVHAIFQLALARPNWGLVFFLSFIAINLKFWIKMSQGHTASGTILIGAQTGILYLKHVLTIILWGQKQLYPYILIRPN